MVPILHTFSWRNLTQNIDNHHFIYVIYCAHANYSNRRGSVSRYSAKSTVIDSQLEHHCIVIIKFRYFLLSILIHLKRWSLHFFLVQQSLWKKKFSYFCAFPNTVPMGGFHRKNPQFCAWNSDDGGRVVGLLSTTLIQLSKLITPLPPPPTPID